MRKLKTSLLTTLFIAITTLFIVGCSNPVAPEKPGDTNAPVEKPGIPENGGGNNVPDGQLPNTPETDGQEQGGDTVQPETQEPENPESGDDNENIENPEQPESPDVQQPSQSNYRIKIASLDKGKEVTEVIIGTGYDLRALSTDGYDNFVSLFDLKLKDGDISDYFDIVTKKFFLDGRIYYEVTPKKELPAGSKVQFIGTADGTTAVSNELTIKAKNISGGGTITPTPTPNPGTNPGGGNKPQFEIGKPVIIPHDYEHEHVYWLGGIETPTQFEDYVSIGKGEVELDEFGKPTGNIVHSTEKVPNYYVVDYSKMDANGKTPTTASGKPTWYNVTKSMYLPDSSMCWAMASAGAMQWWFDYLGEDYTNKLFDIRRYRTDMPKGNSSAKFLLDDIKGKDIHYNPLPNESSGQLVSEKSGIGKYAIGAFGNIGGEPMDLFRLYFLDENINNQPAAKLGSQYVGHRSMGLLHGMDASFSGWLDGSDYLYQKFSISNMRKDDIVNMFKTAIKEEAAIVLHQANLPDNVLGDNGPGAKAHHAIILWGVIFDEKEENIVGLYVGDNNLKEGKLARVDLAFKQLSKDGGRYYYASPFVKQDDPNYVKSTSINSITKLYPPKDRVTKWIDKKYDEVMSNKQ